MIYKTTPGMYLTENLVKPSNNIKYIRENEEIFVIGFDEIFPFPPLWLTQMTNVNFLS